MVTPQGGPFQPLRSALQGAQRWAQQRRGQQPAKGFAEDNPILQQKWQSVSNLERQAQQAMQQHSRSWEGDVASERQKDPTFTPYRFRGSARTQKLEQAAANAMMQLEHNQRVYDGLVQVVLAEKIAAEYKMRHQRSWDRDVELVKRQNPNFVPFDYGGSQATQRLFAQSLAATQGWEQAESEYKSMETQAPSNVSQALPWGVTSVTPKNPILSTPPLPRRTRPRKSRANPAAGNAPPVTVRMGTNMGKP